MTPFLPILALCVSCAALLGVAILHAKLSRAIDEKRAREQRAGMKAARLDIYS